MRVRKSLAYDLFETDIGVCAISWNERGVVQIQLPERSEKALLEKLSATTGRAAMHPPFVKAAIADIKLHLTGSTRDLKTIPIDLEGLPPFHRKVYEALRLVPAGATVSYGQLAAAAGSPSASRAAGQAMSKNPLPIIIPCHRVLAGAGKIGGFSAFGGLSLKERLLKLEADATKREQTLCRG